MPSGHLVDAKWASCPAPRTRPRPGPGACHPATLWLCPAAATLCSAASRRPAGRAQPAQPACGPPHTSGTPSSCSRACRRTPPFSPLFSPPSAAPFRLKCATAHRLPAPRRAPAAPLPPRFPTRPTQPNPTPPNRCPQIKPASRRGWPACAAGMGGGSPLPFTRPTHPASPLLRPWLRLATAYTMKCPPGGQQRGRGEAGGTRVGRSQKEDKG